MIVEDNGRGLSLIEPIDTPSKRLGLLDIRERITLVSETGDELALGQICAHYIGVPL